MRRRSKPHCGSNKRRCLCIRCGAKPGEQMGAAVVSKGGRAVDTVQQAHVAHLAQLWQHRCAAPTPHDLLGELP